MASGSLGYLMGCGVSSYNSNQVCYLDRNTGQKKTASDTERLTFSEPITFQRRQNGTKLIWAQYETGPRPHLIKALHDAHTWLDLLKSGKQITDITQATGLLDGTIWKRVRLACLSPKVQKAILNGTLNPEFTIRYLQSKRVPATWVEQDKLLISKVPC